MNVASLKNKNDEPDEKVVAELEHLLSLAKSGELRSIAVVGSLTGNAVQSSWVTSNAPAMIGQIELLKYRLIRSMPVVDR